MILRGADIDSQLFKENVSPLLPSLPLSLVLPQSTRGLQLSFVAGFLERLQTEKKKYFKKRRDLGLETLLFLWKKFTLNAFVLLLSSAFSHLSCVRCREQE